MSRILEFKEKQETLTFEELKQTIKAKEVGHKRIEHVDIIQMIIDEMSKNEIYFELLPIVATGGRNVAYIERVEDQFGKKSLESTWLSKIFARFVITNFKGEEMADEVRLNYNSDGFEIAYGRLVLVCTNGTTMFKSDTITNYGKDKMPYENIREVFSSWMQNLEEKSKRIDTVIDGMKAIPASMESIKTTIGDLLMLAVEQAYLKGEKAPFNISQVSSFAKSIVENIENAEAHKIETVWDLYNVGTYIQSPERMDTEQIIESNVSWSEYLIKLHNIQ